MLLKTFFFISLPLIIVFQFSATLLHLLVFIFDSTYDHDAAMDTFCPIITLWERAKDEDNT